MFVVVAKVIAKVMLDRILESLINRRQAGSPLDASVLTDQLGTVEEV